MKKITLHALALAIGSAAFAALPAPTLQAQTLVTVTPGNTSGWVDNSDQKSMPAGSATATITNVNSNDGDGSLQLTMTGVSQPAYANGSSLVTGNLSSLSSASFDWSQAVGAPGNPVFRMYINDGGATAGAFNYGSLGWYGTDSNIWQSSGNLASTGQFFLRVKTLTNVQGQLSTDCKSIGQSFDDRRQTITQWIAACNGQNGAFNLTTAQITALQMDQGTWPGFTGTNTSYVDNVNIGYTNGPNTTFDFATTTPEPSSMALLGSGLIGLVPMFRRRRKNA